MSIAENVARIRAQMEAAAVRCGRNPKEIKLCAATKMNDADAVRQAIAAGVDCCGENRVQELTAKLAENAYAGAPVHFIGHLQTNKVNKVVGRAALIESVDSVRLLDKIEHAAAAAGLIQEILIEINIGEESSKSGVDVDGLWALAESAMNRPHVRLRGLMAIPPATATPDETRAFFARMRELLTQARSRFGSELDVLSMGMSGDYPLAIREGATIVRIGTAIYGARDYSKK